MLLPGASVTMCCCIWAPQKGQPNLSLWLWDAQGSCWSVQPRENYGPPEGGETGQQGTGDSQSLPDLLTRTHQHTYSRRTHTERERGRDWLWACLPPKWRGTSMPQRYSDNNLKSLGRQLSHLGRNLIGHVIFDSFLSSQSHCQNLQASLSPNVSCE